MDHEQNPQPPTAQSQTIGDTASQPEHIHVVSPGLGEGNNAAGRDAHSQAPFTHISSPVSDGHSTLPPSHENPSDSERVLIPQPARIRAGPVRVSSPRHTLRSSAGIPVVNGNSAGIDWIVPVEKGDTRRTIGERLQPTIDNAVLERDKYAKKAAWTGYSLNIAIGLQVFFGAMTTGLAAALTGSKQAQISTAILGGLSTLVASYLARARGSGEPELSIVRVKDLDYFLRECRAFQMDHAHEYSTPENGLAERLEYLRWKLEELLGNASGQRKLSPVGVTSDQAAP